MPSSDGRWTELSSENERVVNPDDPAPSRWSELASSSERLVEASDPLFPASRGSRSGDSQHSAGMRLVAGAA